MLSRESAYKLIAENVKPRKVGWRPLNIFVNGIRTLEQAGRRGLYVAVQNVVTDGLLGGFVAEIDGCTGTGNSIDTAIRRAADAWNRKNRPATKRRKT